jgi:hypothetical protein
MYKSYGLGTRDLATMISTPDEGRCMNGIRFIRDDTIRIEVSDLIGFFSLYDVVFPLDLTVFIEDVLDHIAPGYSEATSSSTDW